MLFRSCSSMVESSSSSDSNESESESSLEVMGVTLCNPSPCEESTKECLSDDNMEKMLAKDLREIEKEMYKDMLRMHFSLFISNYEQISRVTVVQHHINLKPGFKLVA